jgi:ribosomal protein S20|tara:strand:- start:976 stop:1410 length:435 start_codon:yes stop_codon:yes gene_type:complete
MKCQACGFDSSRKYNPTKRIISLLEERGKNTICQRRLKRVIKLIRENINSEKDNQKTFYFLQAISKIPDKTVERIIHQYNMDEHVYQGKGFAYLQQMILSGYENEDKMLSNEIKKFGRTPKKVKVERGEYKNVYNSNGGNTISS